MSRYLIPFWAAAANGKKVTFNRSANTATIDGVTYSTADPSSALPVLTVERIQSSVNEGVTVGWRINASKATNRNLTVLLTISESGSYVSSTDLGDKSIILGANTTTVGYSVTTVDDTTDEPNGSVTLTLRSGTGYTVGTPSSGTTIILDNDLPAVPTVSLSRNSTSITEGANAVWTITLSEPARRRVTVGLTLSQVGNFLSTSAGNKSVNINRNQSSTTYTASTTNDTTDEPNGSVTLAIRSVNRGYTISTTAGSSTISVLDNDLPVPVLPSASVSRNSSSITEGANAVWTIRLSSARTSSTTVNLTLSQSGEFLSAFTANNTVTISSGSTSTTFTAGTRNDTTDEPNGSATLSIRSGTGYTIGSPSSSTISILDNDMTASTTYEEKTSERINLGTGHWRGLWRTSNRWAVVDDIGTAKQIKFFTFAGTEQTSERISLGNGFWNGLWRTSNRWAVVDNGGREGIRFFTFAGNEQTSERINIGGDGSWRGLWRTSNRWAVVDNSGAKQIKFFTFTGTEQTSERISLGTGNWSGLWRTDNRWVVVEYQSDELRFFTFAGSEQTSEKISLRSGDYWGGIWKTDTRWVVVDDTNNRLRFFGPE